MGQITEAQLGITVSLPIHFDNIVLICNLLELSNLGIYISGLSEEPDEIVDYEYDNIDELDTDMIDELSMQENEEQFNMKYHELNIKKNVVIHFIYVCNKIYARNLSFRSVSRLFSHDEHICTPMELINDILKGVELFKKANGHFAYIKIYGAKETFSLFGIQGRVDAFIYQKSKTLLINIRQN